MDTDDPSPELAFVPASVVAALGGLALDDPGIVVTEAEHPNRKLWSWHPCDTLYSLHGTRDALVLPASRAALEQLLRRALGTSARSFHRKRTHGDWGIGTVVFTPDPDKDDPNVLYIHVPALDHGVEWVTCPMCRGQGRTAPKNATHIGGGLCIKPLGSVGPLCIGCGGQSQVRASIHMDPDVAFAAVITEVARVASTTEEGQGGEEE